MRRPTEPGEWWMESSPQPFDRMAHSVLTPRSSYTNNYSLTSLTQSVRAASLSRTPLEVPRGQLEGSSSGPPTAAARRECAKSRRQMVSSSGPLTAAAGPACGGWKAAGTEGRTSTRRARILSRSSATPPGDRGASRSPINHRINSRSVTTIPQQLRAPAHPRPRLSRQSALSGGRPGPPRPPPGGRAAHPTRPQPRARAPQARAGEHQA